MLCIDKFISTNIILVTMLKAGIIYRQDGAKKYKTPSSQTQITIKNSKTITTRRAGFAKILLPNMIVNLQKEAVMTVLLFLRTVRQTAALRQQD